MIQLYYKTAANIGYTNPPTAIAVALPGAQAAQQVRSWRGAYSSMRGVTQHIEIDCEKIQSAELPAELIMAHELAHWRCRISSINGGGATSDGDQHGPAFLAAWLVMLRRLGVHDREVNALAWWHGSRYQMPPAHVQIALTAAAAHDDPDEAIYAADAHFAPSQRPWYIAASVMVAALTLYVIAY